MIDRGHVARACLALALCACSGDDPAGPAPYYDADGVLRYGAPRAGPRPSVVWVCAGGVRADAVEPAGGAGPLLPRIAALRSRMTAFPDASSPAGWSMPVAYACVRGLSPALAANRAFDRMEVLRIDCLMAEILRTQGYATASFTGPDWVAGSANFEQGLDVNRTDFHAQTGAADVEAWLRGRPKDRPFYLYVHADDASVPFGPKGAPPAGDPAAERARATAARIGAWWKAHDRTLPEGGGAACLRAWLLDPPLRAALRGEIGESTLRAAAFDELDRLERGVAAPEALAALRAEVEAAHRAAALRADAALGRLLERILDPASDLAVPADAIVIVHSDHGTALGAHGAFGPGRWLREEIVRVPLWIRARGALPEGGALAGSCSLLDLYPTVLDLTGLPIADNLGLDGRSLLTLAAPGARGRPVEASERRCGRAGKERSEHDLRSVRTPRAKYVASLDLLAFRVREELFDLASDPGETRNLLPADFASTPPPPLPASFDADFRAAVERVRALLEGKRHNLADLTQLGYPAGVDIRACGP